MPRIVTLLLHYLGLGDHPEPWIGPVGDYFISDQDATCAYLSRGGRFSPKAVEILSTVLGYTIIATIRDRRFLISKDYVEDITDYRIVRRGKDYIIAEVYSKVYEHIQRGRMIRDEHDLGYWIVSDDPVRGYMERFRSMTPDEFRAATPHLRIDDEGFPIVTPPDEEALRILRGLPTPL